jgi:hypothetical protein
MFLIFLNLLSLIIFKRYFFEGYVFIPFFLGYFDLWYNAIAVIIQLMIMDLYTSGTNGKESIDKRNIIKVLIVFNLILMLLVSIWVSLVTGLSAKYTFIFITYAAMAFMLMHCVDLLKYNEPSVDDFILICHWCSVVCLFSFNGVFDAI